MAVFSGGLRYVTPGVEPEASPDNARRLAALFRKQTLTLLYGARGAAQNHAVVLAACLRALAGETSR